MYSTKACSACSHNSGVNASVDRLHVGRQRGDQTYSGNGCTGTHFCAPHTLPSRNELYTQEEEVQHESSCSAGESHEAAAQAAYFTCLVCIAAGEDSHFAVFELNGDVSPDGSSISALSLQQVAPLAPTSPCKCMQQLTRSTSAHCP